MAQEVRASKSPLADKKFLHCLVDFDCSNSSSHFIEGDLLSLQDGRVEFSDRFTGASTHDGAGDVAKIPGFLRTRKDIDDDRFIGAQRAITRFMRVTGLVAAGDNRMIGAAVHLDDGGIYDGAKPFRG